MKIDGHSVHRVVDYHVVTDNLLILPTTTKHGHQGNEERRLHRAAGMHMLRTVCL